MTTDLSLTRHLLHTPPVLGNVPAQLLALPPGQEELEALFGRHRPLYASLFEAGVLPELRRQRADSPLTYVLRAMEELGRQHKLTVKFVTGSELNENCHESIHFEDEDGEEGLKLDPAALAVQLWGPEPQTYSARAFLRAGREVHRRLTASLLVHLERLSRASIPVLGPDTALDLAHDADFYGDEGAWWTETQSRVAQHFKGELDRAALRAFVKAEGLRTPGGLRRRLGREVSRACHAPLPLDEVRTLAARLPDHQRGALQTLCDGLTALGTLGKRLKALRGDDSRQIARLSMGEYRRVGFILDVWSYDRLEGEWGPCQEVYREAEKRRLEGGDPENANFALILDPQGGARLGEALRVMEEALATVRELVMVIAHWD